MERFRILELIGEGTYGKVFKAQERDTGKVVAIKKFKQNEDEDSHVRKTMVREIKVLTEYRHDNIVHLREHFRDEKGKLYLIFDYIERTLLEELQQVAQANGGAACGMQSDKIKSITYQVLKSIDFLHKNKILHRDIKPENLLLSHNGIIKLCDFGFARGIKDKNFNYTDYVSTRWYRAPELLVGDAAYCETVDLWALGCIFSEIYNGLPLFPGDSDLHTLQLIMETITADDLYRDAPLQDLSKKQRTAFRLNQMFDGLKVPTAADALAAPEHAEEVCLTSLLKGINQVELDFLRRCLIIDGTKRATAEELLKHEYFDSEFVEQYESNVQSLIEKDEEFQIEQAKVWLRTKDDRSELPLEELDDAKRGQSTSDEEDEDIDDDDGSSQTDDSDTARARNKNYRHNQDEEIPIAAMMLMNGTAASAANARGDTRTDSLRNSQKNLDNALAPLLMGNGLVPYKNTVNAATVNDLADVNTLQQLQQHLSTNHVDDDFDEDEQSDGPDDSSDGGARGDSDDFTGSSGEGLQTRATMPEHMRANSNGEHNNNDVNHLGDLDVVMGGPQQQQVNLPPPPGILGLHQANTEDTLQSCQSELNEGGGGMPVGVDTNTMVILSSRVSTPTGLRDGIEVIKFGKEDSPGKQDVSTHENPTPNAANPGLHPSGWQQEEQSPTALSTDMHVGMQDAQYLAVGDACPGPLNIIVSMDNDQNNADLQTAALPRDPSSVGEPLMHHHEQPEGIHEEVNESGSSEHDQNSPKKTVLVEERACESRNQERRQVRDLSYDSPHKTDKLIHVTPNKVSGIQGQKENGMKSPRSRTQMDMVEDTTDEQQNQKGLNSGKSHHLTALSTQQTNAIYQQPVVFKNGQPLIQNKLATSQAIDASGQNNLVINKQLPLTNMLSQDPHMPSTSISPKISKMGVSFAREGPQKIAKVNITFAKKNSQLTDSNNLQFSNLGGGLQNDQSGFSVSQNQQLQPAILTSQQQAQLLPPQQQLNGQKLGNQQQANFMQRRLKGNKLGQQNSQNYNHNNPYYLAQHNQNSNRENGSQLSMIAQGNGTTNGFFQLQQHGPNGVIQGSGYPLQGQPHGLTKSKDYQNAINSQIQMQNSQQQQKIRENNTNSTIQKAQNQQTMLSQEKFKDLPNLSESYVGSQNAHPNLPGGLQAHTSSLVVPPKRATQQYPKFTTASMQSLTRVGGVQQQTNNQIHDATPYQNNSNYKGSPAPSQALNSKQPIKLTAFPKLLDHPVPQPKATWPLQNQIASNSNETGTTSQMMLSDLVKDQELKIQSQNSSLTRIAGSGNEQTVSQNAQGQVHVGSLSNGFNGSQMNNFMSNSPGVASGMVSGGTNTMTNGTNTSQNTTQQEIANNQQVYYQSSPPQPGFPKRSINYKLRNQHAYAMASKRLASEDAALNPTNIPTPNSNNLQTNQPQNQAGFIVLPQVKMQQQNTQPLVHAQDSNASQLQHRTSQQSYLTSSQNNNSGACNQLSPIKVQNKSFTMLKSKNQTSNKVASIMNQSYLMPPPQGNQFSQKYGTPGGFTGANKLSNDSRNVMHTGGLSSQKNGNGNQNEIKTPSEKMNKGYALKEAHNLQQAPLYYSNGAPNLKQPSQVLKYNQDRFTKGQTENNWNNNMAVSTVAAAKTLISGGSTNTGQNPLQASKNVSKNQSSMSSLSPIKLQSMSKPVQQTGGLAYVRRQKSPHSLKKPPLRANADMKMTQTVVNAGGQVLPTGTHTHQHQQNKQGQPAAISNTNTTRVRHLI